MKSQKKKEKITQDNTNNLENETFPIYTEGEQQQATTISSYNNLINTNKKHNKYNITFNNTVKSQFSNDFPQKYSKTQNEL